LGAARVSARVLKEEVTDMKKSMGKEYINKNSYNKIAEAQFGPKYIEKTRKIKA
jgi:predicted RNA-binding protein with PIN domain